MASVILGKYQLQKVLAKTSKGRVFLAKELNTGKEIAIKQINKQRLIKQPELAELTGRQIEAMETIISPNVVRMTERAEDADNRYLIFDYCNGGNLFDYVSKLPNRVVPLQRTMEIAAQILKGLIDIHSEGYIHGRIMTEKVLIDKQPEGETFRICGLGCARKIQSAADIFHDSRATRSLAPQIFEEQKQSQEVDVWAFGVLVYYMLNNEYPFHPTPKREIIDIKAKLPFSYAESVKKTTRNLTINCNEHTEDLFLRIFEFDPKKRITTYQLKQHPLLQDYFDEEKSWDSLIVYNKYVPKEASEKGPIHDDDSNEDPQKKITFAKEMDELEFSLEHKEFVFDLSETFRREGKYLPRYLKYALRYNLLKFYLLESTKLANTLRRKCIPEQANASLNWPKFFDSPQLKAYLNQLDENLRNADAGFKNSYQDCKDELDIILKEIPAFSKSFSPIITEKDFNDFKLSFRTVTNRAHQLLSIIHKSHEQNERGTAKLVQLRIKVIISHALNRVFDRTQLTDNFACYFEWKKGMKLQQPVEQFNFQSFAIWIVQEERKKIVEVLKGILKKYFGE